ncbi:iron uptake transporter deferrochelatase/peroxidase subunit [Mammaliicoccus stepanovicii]|uniref:Deferrochelatase n=1 Tax=Mammaliicoccus stepanovicii TaxID=643214 RepID=A0A240A4K3_9STAP|nr:iron uptake transporter deferrochelatase/peroxidase subunit [Mammaliicoccus stepanovicii]PNZ71922.1 deferrochelatase/peroxidase EfeB [Mammaliicoccus stepanovicii]GGI39441.1 peroxidase [Mammaliicoccus stepanovicii]SNV77918.1 putative Tat-translocated protein [Mammaliicoccus stepanovicii]
MSNESNHIARRDFLKLAGVGGAGLILGSTGVGGTFLASQYFAKDKKNVKNKVNFYGKYQSGITTQVQKHIYFVVLSINKMSVSEVKEMFKTWTNYSVHLMNGEPVQELGKNKLLPSPDTGETIGLDANRLTLTFGISPSFFEKVGLTKHKPELLEDLPHFPKDQLDKAYTGGDICIQACSDDPQVNFHAIRNLIRVAKGEVSMKWSQSGFNSFKDTEGNIETPRNLFSFKDGTGNPSINKQSELDKFVFIQDGWAKNGTYIVARRIQMLLETWDRTALEEQEATFGRYRHSGAPIGKEKEYDEFDPDIKDKNGERLIEKESHVSLAKQSKTNILRRSFSYSDGINPNTGAFDAGLLFLSFQKSPEQFIKIQNKMGAADKLNEYITHRGSGIFLCLPGVQEGEYLGETLFNRI